MAAIGDVADMPVSFVSSSRAGQGGTGTSTGLLIDRESSQRVPKEAKKRHGGNARSAACKYCGKTFLHGGHLTRHMRIHTGERPFACDVCGMRFTSSSNLKRHQQTHAGTSRSAPEDRPRCPDCDRTFFDRSTMRRHRRIHMRSLSDRTNGSGAPVARRQASATTNRQPKQQQVFRRHMTPEMTASLSRHDEGQPHKSVGSLVTNPCSARDQSLDASPAVQGVGVDGAAWLGTSGMDGLDAGAPPSVRNGTLRKPPLPRGNALLSPPDALHVLRHLSEQHLDETAYPSETLVETIFMPFDAELATSSAADTYLLDGQSSSEVATTSPFKPRAFSPVTDGVASALHRRCAESLSAHSRTQLAAFTSLVGSEPATAHPGDLAGTIDRGFSMASSAGATSPSKLAHPRPIVAQQSGLTTHSSSPLIGVRSTTSQGSKSAFTPACSETNPSSELSSQHAGASLGQTMAAGSAPGPLAYSDQIVSYWGRVLSHAQQLQHAQHALMASSWPHCDLAVMVANNAALSMPFQPTTNIGTLQSDTQRQSHRIHMPLAVKSSYPPQTFDVTPGQSMTEQLTSSSKTSSAPMPLPLATMLGRT